jgi:hypothetical protein
LRIHCSCRGADTVRGVFITALISRAGTMPENSADACRVGLIKLL